MKSKAQSKTQQRDYYYGLHLMQKNLQNYLGGM